MTTPKSPNPPGDGESDGDLTRFYKSSSDYRDHLVAKAESHFARYVAMIRRYTPRGSRVLETGCGAGQAARGLRDLGYAVTATDLSPLFLGAARRASVEEGKTSLFLSASVYRLPFRDERFDAVCGCELIEHLTDPPVALDEFARVLRTGGHIVLRSPALASPVWPLLDLPNLLLGRGGRPPHYSTIGDAARFFAANAGRTVRILTRRHPAFERRAPDLTPGSVGGDRDAAYWSSPVQLARHLRLRGFRILQQAEGPARWAPWLSPTIALVARKG